MATFSLRITHFTYLKKIFCSRKQMNGAHSLYGKYVALHNVSVRLSKLRNCIHSCFNMLSFSAIRFFRNTCFCSNSGYCHFNCCCCSLVASLYIKKKSATCSVTVSYLNTSTLPSQDGETPLIRATQKNHTAIVSLLLEKGASVSVADKVSRIFFLLFFVSYELQLKETGLVKAARASLQLEILAATCN